MTDEEAMRAARHEWLCASLDLSHPRTINEADAYASGFRAGLAHARRWRPLTSDEATWPPIDERVMFRLVTGFVAIGEHVDMPTGAVILDGEDDATYHLGDSLVAWLPLPPPSEEDGR